MIADAYDAMTSTRAYRKALPQEVAFQELRDKAGIQFHPACVEALIRAIEKRGEKHGDGLRSASRVRERTRDGTRLGRSRRPAARPRPELGDAGVARAAPAVRRRRGVIAAASSRTVDRSPTAPPDDAARCLAAGLVLGELLVLRLEDGSAVPLSFAVLIVLASSFALAEYACAVVGAELICVRAAHHRPRSRAWRSHGDPVRAHRGRGRDVRGVPRRDASLRRTARRVAAVLVALGAAAVAQVVVDVGAAHGPAARRVVLGPRPARVAGDRVVGHADGDRLPRRRRRRRASASGARCCSPRRCSRPGTRSSASTRRPARTARRSRRWRWRRSSAGSCRPGTRERVATLASAMGEPARPAARPTSTTSRWPRCCTTSARSRSTSPRSRAGAEPHRGRRGHERDVARDPAARGARATSSPATSTTPRAGSRCRCCGIASEYDDLTVARRRAARPSRSSRCGRRRAYVYDERVVDRARARRWATRATPSAERPARTLAVGDAVQVDRLVAVGRSCLGAAAIGAGCRCGDRVARSVRRERASACGCGSRGRRRRRGRPRG